MPGNLSLIIASLLKVKERSAGKKKQRGKGMIKKK
jgi:hypothetical protein